MAKLSLVRRDTGREVTDDDVIGEMEMPKFHERPEFTLYTRQLINTLQAVAAVRDADAMLLSAMYIMAHGKFEFRFVEGGADSDAGNG